MAMTENPAWIKPGQVLAGAGRPKGSVAIFSKNSVAKLQELGFDPIESMVKMIATIDKKLKSLESKPRPSEVAIAQLYNIRHRCITELMRYGYSRTIESTEILTPDVKPMVVKLNMKDKSKTDIP